jgi:hypothetical protein
LNVDIALPTYFPNARLCCYRLTQQGAKEKEEIAVYGGNIITTSMFSVLLLAMGAFTQEYLPAFLLPPVPNFHAPLFSFFSFMARRINCRS